MRAAVALAQGDGNLRNGGFTIGVEKLGPVGDDGTVFLVCAAEEARNVHEGHQRDVEGIAETHEAGCLAGSVDVQAASKYARLVGHDSDAPSAHMGEADYDILGVVLVDFEELSVIHDGGNDAVHIVGLVRIVGNDVVETFLNSADRVGSRPERS